MRVVVVGVCGLLIFWVLWNLAQLALLGPDRIDLYPTPRLTIGYLRWLLTMIAAAVLAALPAGLLMWAIWWALSRLSR